MNPKMYSTMSRSLSSKTLPHSTLLRIPDRAGGLLRPNLPGRQPPPRRPGAVYKGSPQGGGFGGGSPQKRAGGLGGGSHPVTFWRCGCQTLGLECRPQPSLGFCGLPLPEGVWRRQPPSRGPRRRLCTLWHGSLVSKAPKTMCRRFPASRVKHQGWMRKYSLRVDRGIPSGMAHSER